MDPVARTHWDVNECRVDRTKGAPLGVGVARAEFGLDPDE